MKIQRLGVFDSGVGGLSVLQALQRLPIPEFIYFADTVNLPYGEKSPEQILAFTSRAIQFLIDQGIDALVLACHTASTITLPLLAETYPQLPIIGVVDPVVRQALTTTRNGVIGVIGTPATIASARHRTKIHTLSPQAQVLLQACPRLVPLIEAGLHTSHELDEALKSYLEPLVTSIDTLIIGCTHYELIKDQLASHAPGIALISAPEETTIQVADMLDMQQPCISTVTYFVTGDREQFRNNVQKLCGWRLSEIYHPWTRITLDQRLGARV